MMKKPRKGCIIEYVREGIGRRWQGLKFVVKSDIEIARATESRYVKITSLANILSGKGFYMLFEDEWEDYRIVRRRSK